MGIPHPVVGAIGEGLDSRSRIAKQNSAIGNSFHVPSVMLVLLLLFQLSEVSLAKIPPSLANTEELKLRVQITGTIFDSSYLKAFGDVQSTQQLTAEMFQLLPGITFPMQVIDQVGQGLEAIDIASLQTYWAFLLQQGHTSTEAPPTWSTQQHRGLAWAAHGRQRAAAHSKFGLDHLLEPGLGKEQHIAQARGLDSPYDVETPHDMDIKFALYAFRVWGRHLQAWRNVQAAKFWQVARLLQDLQPFITKHRVASAVAVASTRQVALMAFATALMRWPDRQQAIKYVHGFEILGEISSSSIFREVPGVKLDDIDSKFFGEPARAAVADLLQSGPPRDADLIFNLTEVEIGKSYCSQLKTATEINERFGTGKWRPLHRFVIHQAGDKARLIDDGRRGEQNRWATLHETIFTINVDFVPAVAAAVAREAINFPYRG